MNRIGIYGSLGRMGQAIIAAMPALDAVHAGGVDAGEDPGPLAGPLRAVANEARVAASS